MSTARRSTPSVAVEVVAKWKAGQPLRRASCISSSSSVEPFFLERAATMASEKGKEVARNCAEASAGKRRKVVVGHFHEEVSPTHFCKVLLTPGLNLLPIPPAFREHLGQIPKEIALNTKTGCNWRVSVVDFNGCAAIDNGWPAFSMCHNLKIGNLLTFKVLGDDEFRVTVFNTDGVEVIRKCEEHPRNILLIRASIPPVA